VLLCPPQIPHRPTREFFFLFRFFPFDPFCTFSSFPPSSCHLCSMLLSLYNKRNTNIHAPSGIRTHNPSKRAAADPRFRPRGNWDRQGSNPGLRGAWPATNRLSHGTALRYLTLLCRMQVMFIVQSVDMVMDCEFERRRKTVVPQSTGQ
jgi:hypothetical protein